MPSGRLGVPVTVSGSPSYLKAYTKSSNALDATLRVVDRVSHVIGMEFGLRKSAVAHVKQGKYVSGETTFCWRRGR